MPAVADVPPSTASPALFTQTGTLERFPADARAALGAQFVPSFGQTTDNQKRTAGTAILIPQARQVWQIYPLIDANPPVTGIVMRDLDSLKILHTKKIAARLGRTSTDALGGGDWAHAIDDSGTRVWLLEQTFRSTFEIDTRTFSMTRRLLMHDLTPLPPPVSVGGLTYDRFEDDLIILYSGPPATSAGNANTFVFRLDVSGPAPAAFPADTLRTRLYRLRSCTAPVTSTDAGSDTSNWDILVTKEFLYVPCQRAGHTVIAVRMARPTDAGDTQHPEDFVAGPVYGDAVFADQHSGRLFVTTINREVWVFETSTMSFVGVIATNATNAHKTTGFGLDPITGRVFFQSATFGLGMAEGRFFPIPQARTMPRLTVGQERIWSDAPTKRVFVLEGSNGGGPLQASTKADHYRIYVTGPAPAPPAAPDPDRNTIDTEEKEGVTEARWNASGSGYGTRILLAKGYATVPPSPTVGIIAPTTALISRLKDYCGYTDRDVSAGRVAKAEYDTGSTAAEAVAVRVDSATEQDLNKPSRCNLDANGQRLDQPDRWAYKAASCASSEGNVPDSRTQGSPGDLGPSEVSCPRPGGTLTARAETELKGIVRVDRSWSETAVEKLPGGGVRSTVTSVAQGISIADMLHIGEIRATAVSTSNGRPQRKDMSTHQIKISEVRVGDESFCHTTCDPVVLEERLNTAAGSRALFRTGGGRNSGRDQALLEGSPRGAQTAVQKSVARQSSDRALVGDFTVEVPAFEITVFNDNPDPAGGWGRARQLYQFAGVASSSTYNIVKHPTFGELPLVEEPSSDALDGDDLVGLAFDGSGGEGTNSGTSYTSAPAASRVDRPSGWTAPFVAVARGLRLLLADPRRGVLLLAVWALLGLPGVLARRRRMLTLAA